jgi:hypothetical protein
MLPRFTSPRPECVPGILLGLALVMVTPRAARAEDTIAFKDQSFQESDNRIRVDTNYAQIDADPTTSLHVKAMGLIDSIAGATPTGEKAATPGGQVPLAHMHDRRKAWNADLTQQFERFSLSLGFANSRESDYFSNGWSLNSVIDFNQKNTSLLLGYGRADDRINEEKLGWTITRPKRSNDFLVGINQLIDANTSVTANLSYGQARGYMSDPYKIVSTTMLDLDPGTYYTVPENRPMERNKGSLFLGLNRNVEAWHGAVEASYRYYHDSYGINSHTFSVLWLQKLGDQVTLQPFVRYYRQTAADFYYVDLDKSHVVTSYGPLGETGTGRAPFYSSDYRLSYMQTVDTGLKVVWQVKRWLEVDAAYDRYASRGLDHVTPQSAFFTANVFTFGLKFTR